VVFLDVALVALVAGKLLGGRFSALAETPIAGKWLVFGALGLQLVAFPSEALPWSTPTGLAKVLWVASYVLLIAMLVRNRALPGILVVAAGLASNVVAIAANHGLMPVRPSALRAAGRSYQVHNNSISLGHPHLSWLVDRWAVPGWLPMANVFSVGDVLIAAGTTIAIVFAMRRRPSDAGEDQAGAAVRFRLPRATPPRINASPTSAVARSGSPRNTAPYPSATPGTR